MSLHKFLKVTFAPATHAAASLSFAATPTVADDPVYTRFLSDVAVSG